MNNAFGSAVSGFVETIREKMEGVNKKLMTSQHFTIDLSNGHTFNFTIPQAPYMKEDSDLGTIVFKSTSVEELEELLQFPRRFEDSHSQ